MNSPPTTAVVATNGSHNPNGFRQVLLAARQAKKRENLHKERSELIAKLEDVNQHCEGLQAELVERAAAPEINLRPKRTQGVILAAIAVIMMLGMTLLIAILLLTTRAAIGGIGAKLAVVIDTRSQMSQR